MKNFQIDVDSQGIALVVFNTPGRSVNTITAGVRQELLNVALRLRSDARIRGAVVVSGKSTGFCVGADLHEMSADLAAWARAETVEELRQALAESSAVSVAIRALETCGKPVAAAISGAALGGGLEIALGCHYRVVADDPRLQLGLPEAKVGLMPGAGGTQRLIRLAGIEKMLPCLLEGRSMSPKESHELGIVDEVVPATEVVEAAKRWVRSGGEHIAAWDKRSFELPGGQPYSPGGQRAFMVAGAQVLNRSFANYPAQAHVLKAVFEGAQVPIDAALRIESRHFLAIVRTPAARAMVRTLFLSAQELAKGAARPAVTQKFEAKKVAVLGAGMMGAGIAYVQAKAGIDTVLIDVSLSAAERGKAHSRKLLDKAVANGSTTPEQADSVLGRITPTADYAKIGDADLVIEAVFENRELKAEVIRKAEAHSAEDAVFASNTSTLPITELAQAAQRRSRFVGIHFFSPVDRMNLVEIIRGRETSDETVAKAVDFVLQLRKTPIVVNDGRGFYTSRTFRCYINEGMEMLAEGIAPAIIENVGRATSMPRGPLELADDVALDLLLSLNQQARRDLGEGWVADAEDRLVATLVEQFGRLGRKNGKGLYDYAADGTKELWRGLAEVYPVKVTEASSDLVPTLKERLLFRQALEAARCVDEGVIDDPRAVDVGAIMAWGFASWTGGPLSYIDSIGVPEFIRRSQEFAQMCGPRFAPPSLLEKMAECGKQFYGARGK